jgi:hypothetical protein
VLLVERGEIGAGGGEKPLVSGYEGLMTLKVMDAVKLAANSGELVRIERSPEGTTAQSGRSREH